MNLSFQTKAMRVDPLTAEQPVTSEEGRKILERVRSAMSKATYEKIAPQRIRPMPGQPRKTFNPIRLALLADSINDSGQMMPGILRRITPDAEGHDFELCDGERRLRAVLMAGVAHYNALVIDIDDRAAQYVVSIVTNFNRDGHTLLELVDSVVKQHDELKLTIVEVAKNIALSSGYTQNLYGLRRLVPEVRDLLDPNLTKKCLPSGAAFEISTLPAEQQLPLAQRIQSGQIKTRMVHREVQQIARSLNMGVREYTIAPSKRRAAIQSRIETLSMSVEELRKLLSDVGAELAIHEWPVFKLESLNTMLEKSAADLLACHEKIAPIISVKKVKW